MSAIEIMEALQPATASPRILIAATFTAEPIQDALAFWMDLLGLRAAIEFAPYDQIYQQLLDPASVFSRNRRGLNVLLYRPEDWLRALPASQADDERHIEQVLGRNADDLLNAMRALTGRAQVPLVVVACPDGPHARARLLDRARERISDTLRELPGVSLIEQSDLDLYRVDDYYDARRDRLGHVPYTPRFFAALGTALARRAHAHLATPHKVVVLDCDNTLWQGVVGEDGVDGIKLSPPFLALQRFMVSLAERGILLCLCSKNAEADVMQVFERRADMLLRKEHLVAWRINWQPKWDNIRSLATELNLGLDSFVYLDDNPIECAEVGLACPEVLTLQVPIDQDIESFLRHVWVFDRTRVTSEDRKRTTMYRQEAERARFRRAAPSLDEFLAGLDLEVVIKPPEAPQIARVAQLTQRTNQFNFTTVRRSEAEIRALGSAGLECRIVEVRDRFGDYGLVGLMIYALHADALTIDTLLLSCRVLGRGVEHRMLRQLGQIARERHLARVSATVLFTRKNQPARDFLEAVAHEWRTETQGGARYDLPAERAASLEYQPHLAPSEESPALEQSGAGVAATSQEPPEAQSQTKSRRFARISGELRTAEQILGAMHARAAHKSRAMGSALLAPRTSLESQLAEIWTDILNVSPIGVHDNFFDLGGTSLLAVDLCAHIEQRIGRQIPLTSVIEAPTIEQLAQLLSIDGPRDSLVLIRDGQGRAPVFLIHDGDGETMLYRNLALHLHRGHAVYGLQPYSAEGLPMVHTRIPEMAAYHIAKIRSVQPRGPYLLGGMCAGGVIAFEVAKQLREQGEQVALVAILDAADPAAAPKTWRLTQAGLRRSMDVLRERRQYGSPARRAVVVIGKLLRKARNLSVYVLGELGRGIRDGIRLRLIRTWSRRGQRPPRIVGRIPVRTAYRFAERQYRPAAPFDGELVLFRATRGSGDDEPYIERYDDPLLGWALRTTRGVRAIDVPGGHSSMLQEPHVAVLAERLQSYIDSALRERHLLAARIA